MSFSFLKPSFGSRFLVVSVDLPYDLIFLVINNHIFSSLGGGGRQRRGVVLIFVLSFSVSPSASRTHFVAEYGLPLFSVLFSPKVLFSLG